MASCAPAPAGELHSEMKDIKVSNVVLSLQQLLLAPRTVAETDYVATLPARLARRFADKVDAFGLPIYARGFALFAGWRPRSHNDPAHAWLRNRLVALAGNR